MEETPKALRVAVVEDDPRIQQLISAEITDEGHACICFGSAEDFLDEAGCAQESYGWDTNSGPAAPGFSP